MNNIVKELILLIETHGWAEKFEAAIAKAASYKIPSIAHIDTLAEYLTYIDELVNWAPVAEDPMALKSNLYDHFIKFYFFLNQSPVRELQNAIEPGDPARPLTPLSEWIVKYATQWGSFLDTVDSARHIKTFREPTGLLTSSLPGI